MIANGIKPNNTIFAMIIQTYIKQDQLTDAFRLKDIMAKQYNVSPSLITYHAIIQALLNSHNRHNNISLTGQNTGSSSSSSSSSDYPLQLYHIFHEIFANDTQTSLIMTNLVTIFKS
eukprot:UN09809